MVKVNKHVYIDLELAQKCEALHCPYSAVFTDALIAWVAKQTRAERPEISTVWVVRSNADIDAVVSWSKSKYPQITEREVEIITDKFRSELAYGPFRILQDGTIIRGGV